ncbi:MAG: SH3 domain-containing protein [Lachnospiraceae bacterium]|nr:SH3 domain-containing protein [Lachnospiraceae bacterium]
MSKKSTLFLLSILHICILGICILTIYNNRHSGITIAHVSSDTRTTVTQLEPDTITEPPLKDESAQQIETVPDTQEEATETETETITQTETETTPETEPGYSFRFTGKYKNLNIRDAPSTNARIIGKIPVGGCGSVLELTNEKWMLAEYDGIVGYCSRDWVELQTAEK